MKIGLIGEAPHDTNSIKVILSKRYPNFEFFALINNIHGSQLDQTQPTKRLLRLEYERKKPDFVIVIRDLDGLHHEVSKKKKRLEQFNSLKSVVDKKAFFLLHVYEIEAMILADIEKFGLLFECDVQEYPNPSGVENPKEELKRLSKKYSEVKNAQIFELLDLEVLINKCKYFEDFLRKFNKAI